jgi:hypothetical protein
MDHIYNYIEHLWITIASFPFVIQVAVFFIIINFSVSALFYLRMLQMRRINDRQESIINSLRPKMIEFFEGVLKSERPLTDAEISESFKAEFGKLDERAYISLIPSLEEVVVKESFLLDSINFKNTILGLEIEKYLEKKLDFSNTRTRLRALQTLSRLKLTISDSKILPHTYSKNRFLNKESRTSYLGVSKNDPFKFFENSTQNLNQWDQIGLMQQFLLHHKDNLPNFSKWIKYSKETSQVIFFVRMVAYFDQKNSIPTLVELLETYDHEIRSEVILALGRMKVIEVEQTFIDMYFSQPLNCQNAIVEAVSYIHSGNALDFLKQAYESVNNYDTKKLIAEVIYLYGKSGKDYFKELQKNERGFNQLILKHVENPLIYSKLKNYNATEAKLKRPNRIKKNISRDIL